MHITIFHKVVLIEKRNLKVYAMHFARSQRNILRKNDQKKKRSRKLFVSFKELSRAFSTSIRLVEKTEILHAMLRSSCLSREENSLHIKC